MPTTLRVVCSWCSEVMRPGNDPATDQISHGCCCACKIKYFPTLGDASKCQLELIEREHDEDTKEHVDTLECSRCERIVNPERVPCNCAEVHRYEWPDSD